MTIIIFSADAQLDRGREELDDHLPGADGLPLHDEVGQQEERLLLLAGGQDHEGPQQ